MRDPQAFDYNKPTRDTLAGIYVEWTDSAAENPAAEMKKAPVGTVGPIPEEKLFGLTMTVGDENTAERLSRAR